MRTRVISKLVGFGVLLGIASIAYGGPIGPPNGPPYDPSTVILNMSTPQAGKTTNLSSATISNLYSSTITATRITIGGVVVSTSVQSGTSVYPATSTIIASKGIAATTMTLTGILNGTTVTITGLFTGAAVHGTTATFTGTIIGSNLSGTNTGDVTIGTGNGISLAGQIVSLAAASTVSTGALRAVDFITFNNKLSPTGDGSGLTGLTKGQVGLGNVANVDQQDAANITTGTVGTARLGSGTASSARYLRGDSSWQLLNSTAAGLGNVTNNTQVKIADYTQKGAILIGISTGVFAVFPPGTNGYILQSDSASSYGYSWIISPKSFTVYPATATAGFPFGLSATTMTLTGRLTGVDVTLTGLLTGTTIYASSGSFTGTLNASNLTGSNSGDVTIGTPNGLSIAGQSLSIALATSISTGALKPSDWTRFDTATSATDIYPATATIVASKGISATTMTLTGLLIGTTVQAVNGFFSSTISASNFSGSSTGTNTGNVSLGTSNGLSLSSQALSLSSATATSTGSLTANDWTTFNSKISTNGATVTNFTVVSGTVAVSSLTATNATITNLNMTVSTGSYYYGANGSATNPTYSLTGDPNTGMYGSAADDLVIVTGGTAAMDFSNSQVSIESGRQLIIPSGKKLLLDGSGSGDTYLVEASANVMQLVAGGVAVATLTASGVSIATATISSATITAGTMTSGTITSFTASTATITRLSVTATTSTLVQAGDGTSAAPSHSFSSDPDTGFYNAAANKIGVTAGGVAVGTFTSSGVSLIGTNTNDSANSGWIGDRISSGTQNGVSSTGTGQFFDIVALSISSGDWDVSGLVVFTLNGSAQTVALMAITSTSGNSTSGQIDGDNRCAVTVPTATNDNSGSIPAFRVSLSATTTYYLKARMDYTGGPPKAYGRISARKPR